ncbi:MAG: glycogen synthase GlgA [Clostridia bacterium]|nr:glycogen synthase GlgA [Clostridia bacterium]
MKILYAVSECKPFIASGGLADVAGSLPQALRKEKISVRVVLPLYGGIGEEYRRNMKFLMNFTVPVAWRRQYCGLFEYSKDGVIYYFIDNEYYFKRENLYGYYDDAERFAFFSRAVLDIIQYIDWKPDIINCNDWQTALVPVYYSAMYTRSPGYDNIKTVFTIHNIQYQGKYGDDILENVVGLSYYDKSLLEYDGCINFMKGAIETANKVSTVSPTYAEEILDPWYSWGLDSILSQRIWKLKGILNGISYDMYNPETDKDIFKNYSAKNLKGKAVNKAGLQERLCLPADPDVPIVGMVTRLVSHKGLDLVKAVLEEFVTTTNAQVVILGSGDRDYEDFFRYLSGKYPEQVSLTLGFVPELANKIYAGSDMFLMPSKSEPCGLSQMVALRYGSIPIVRETGGLKDSVRDSGDGQGNGFTFANYNAHEMLHAMRRAVEGYADRNGWNILVKRAMECDLSWKRSAKEYIEMYKELL